MNEYELSREVNKHYHPNSDIPLDELIQLVSKCDAKWVRDEFESCLKWLQKLHAVY